MKRIVRLTENDLARIVRRVINEQNEVANTILSQMETLCNNGKVESEAMKQAIYKIKDKATYDAILKQVNRSPEFKKRQGNNYTLITDWLQKEGMVLKSRSIATEIIRHLQQFNNNEDVRGGFYSSGAGGDW